MRNRYRYIYDPDTITVTVKRVPIYFEKQPNFSVQLRPDVARAIPRTSPMLRGQLPLPATARRPSVRPTLTSAR